MSHKDYYCTTPLETADLIRGWERRHARYMEGCRLIAHTVAQVNSTKKLPPANVWMPLVTDAHKGNKASKGEAGKEEILAAQARLRQAKLGKKDRPIKIMD